MTAMIQNILVLICLILALLFLGRTFLWKSSKHKKSCGGKDDCGCH
nr:FeoB-associated Cys-rich membrane protein [Aestuariivivens sediminicola]